MRSFKNWSSRSGDCRPERLRPLFAAWLGRTGDPAARSGPDAGSRPAAGQFDAPSACRLQWRPSRGLAAALVALGLLAGFSALMSELPAALAVPMAIAAMGWALACAVRELRRPPRALLIGAGRASLDGEPIAGLRLHWRGRLARLDYRAADGRRRRLLWWPDTLDAAARRELRLAVAVSAPARDAASVAP